MVQNDEQLKQYSHHLKTVHRKKRKEKRKKKWNWQGDYTEKHNVKTFTMHACNT
jgi:hypothetical protein